MNKFSILDSLNPAQQQAVSADARPTLVLAGAGSGKTRVLVHRIAWLLLNEHASPSSILAVTFTNKSAAEMRHRVQDLIMGSLGGMWVGTFHGLAHRMLRMHWQEANLDQNFQILDAEDQLRIVKRICKELSIDDSRFSPRQLVWFINHRKDEGVRAHFVDPGDDYVQKVQLKVYLAYEQYTQRNGLVDFAELLLRSLELIRDNALLQQHYQQRFRYILVDEFQDTNALQYAWLRLLCTRDTPLFAVGDDDQSIYGWRGAKIENIHNFRKDFPATEVVRLEQNYRSTANILKAANGLIAHNPDRLGKNLWTEGDVGELIHVYEAMNELDEAQFIAERIQSLRSKYAAPYADMAVLYRSNAQSRVLELKLNDQQIPYQIYGGLRFFDRAEIRDILAYLRFMIHPGDDASFERIINLPARGIGERSMEALREYAGIRACSLWEVCTQHQDECALSSRAKNALNLFVSQMQTLRSETQGLGLKERVESLLNGIDLKNHYLQKEKGEKGQSRVENLDEFINAAQSFVSEQEWPDGVDEMTAFLAHTALESGDQQSEIQEDAVQMMTLHSAKGLEFPYVFLVGMEDGLFPHKMSIDEPGRIEEERRLCYVGITRAGRQLTMSYANQRQLHGKTFDNIPSRFLKEIPEETLKPLHSDVRVYSHQPTSASKYKSSSSKPLFGGQANNDYQGLRIGQMVTHPKFGQGVVLSLEGSGQSARAQVQFKNIGSKWLVIAFAKLQ